MRNMLYFVAIMIFCAVQNAYAGTTLKDFVPLIIQTKIQENLAHLDDNIDLKTHFKNTPQYKLIELAKAYSNEHFLFLDRLSRLARTEEERRFVQDYSVFLRNILLNALLKIYDNEEAIMYYALLMEDKQGFIDSLPKSFAKSYLNDLDMEARESDIKRFKAKYEQNESKQLQALAKFFQDQEQFVASFGDEFFTFLHTYKPRSVCTEASCGHPTELFIVANTQKELTTKQNEKALERAAQHAQTGYLYYLTLHRANPGEIASNINLAKLFERYTNYAKQHNQQQQLTDMHKQILEELMPSDDDPYLEKLLNFLSYTYLNELYSGKYALNLETKLLQKHTPADSEKGNATEVAQSPEQIITKSIEAGLDLCGDSAHLSKKAQKLCASYIGISTQDLPNITSKAKTFITNGIQNCASLHYEEASSALHLVVTNSKTNNTTACKILQKQLKNIAKTQTHPLQKQESTSLELTIEQKAALRLIASPKFKEYIQYTQAKTKDPKVFKNLCEAKSPLACAYLAAENDDVALLQTTCAQGVIQSCHILSRFFLNKKHNIAIQTILESSKRGCELGGIEMCAIYGEVVAFQTKSKVSAKTNIDSPLYAKELQEGFTYLKNACDAGSERGCLALMEYAELYAKHLQNENLANKEVLQRYTCEKTDFLLDECAKIDNIVKDMIEINRVFMLKAIYKDGTFNDNDFARAEKICAMGITISCKTLMRMYDYKFSGKTYVKKMRDVSTQLCERNDSEGCSILAEMQSNKKDFTRLHIKACDVWHYQKWELSPMDSMRLNRYESCKIAGDAYAVGLNVQQNTDMAKAYYFKSCTNGNQDACEPLLQ